METTRAAVKRLSASLFDNCEFVIATFGRVCIFGPTCRKKL